MDLQKISQAQTAIEDAQNELYDLKELCIDGKTKDENLVLKYSRMIEKLHDSLRTVLRQKTIDEKERSDNKQLNMNLLIIKIAECSDLTIEELNKYKGRKREYVLARQLHMALLTKVFNITKDISASIYGLNRTTCFHSIETIKNLYDTDSNFRIVFGPVFEICKKHDEKKFYKYLKT